MFKFDGFEFDENSAELRCVETNKVVFLRQKLVALLSYFSKHQSRIITKQELLDELWDHGQYRERSLSQSILELRKALGDSASSPKYIRTIQNQGYQWICVEQKDPPSDSVPLNKLTLKWASLRWAWLSLVPLIVIAFMWGGEQYSSNATQPPSLERYSDNQALNVLVLPFINHSGTSAMNWVEYGLSEMLAYDLAQIPELKVTTPTQLSSRYSDKSSSESIQQLLKEYQADVAVRGVFSLNRQEQIITYKLLTPTENGTEKQLQRNDLAVSMPDIASEIYRDLKPSDPAINLPEYTYLPSAMHDFARGLQALQSEGYILAQYYFQASIQIDKNHHWSVLYQAISQINLGRWQEADQLLSDLEDISSESGLLAAVHYWKALLLYRQGLLDESAKQILASNKYLELSPQSLLMIHVSQLNQKLSRLRKPQERIQIHDEFHIHDQESLLEVPLFETPELYSLENIANIQSVSRQLTIKGHKPALLRLLISHSLSKGLTVAKRSSSIARAVEIVRKLQQPYDLALVLLIQGRIAIEQRLPLAKDYLLQSLAIAKELNTPPLLTELAFYISMSDVIIAVDTHDIKSALSQLQHIDIEKLSSHEVALYQRMVEWVNEH